MRTRPFTLILAIAVASMPTVAAHQAVNVSADARRVHSQAIVIDTHADTTQRLIYDGFDLGARDTKGDVDIPRMREGGVGGQFFSIWMPSTVTGPEAVKRALRQIDAVREQVRRHPQDLALAVTADDIRRARQQGRIAALMGMEGGHMIDDDMGVLRMYAVLGVRYLTLTHFLNNNWADSSTDKPKHNGLTAFGKDVVRELNRLGVMVDISHVSDKTLYDALELTKAPVIASHSSCRALCNHARNMTDEMIRALAKNGGVIQINYERTFLSEEARRDSVARGNQLGVALAEVAKLCGENQACQTIEEDRRDREGMLAGTLPKVGWETIVDHIDHVVMLVGPEHVGLGSDFDGASMPLGMENCSKLAQITEALLKKGYTESDVQKILGGNLLRVMEQVERVSREIQGSEASKPSRGL